MHVNYFVQISSTTLYMYGFDLLEKKDIWCYRNVHIEQTPAPILIIQWASQIEIPDLRTEKSPNRAYLSD